MRPRVWAPKARKVELETGAERHLMKPFTDGWWEASTELRHGAYYSFRVSGHGPFPDPRSPSQPRGPHQPSRWIDHTLFEWQHPAFQAPPLASAIIYELHIGTFTTAGTFDSAIDRLDYLFELGITHLEIMPVAEFNGERGWGYDGVSLYAPHHAYGGPDGFKRFIDAAHQRGLAVLLDVVYNHLGPSGNYLARFGPYFTKKYRTPWGEAINFDGEHSDEVRRFFIDNALMWLRDYRLDGLRLDAVQMIFDQSAVHILEQLATEVDDLSSETGRHLVLIAETDLNDPRVYRSREAGGYGLDAAWADDLHHTLHTVLTGERTGYYADYGNIGHVAKALAQGYVYDGRYSLFRRRTVGRSAAGLSAHHFVTCLQNHDQIGNRARGERIGQLVPAEAVKIASALSLLAPTVPLLFMGEEWAPSSPFQYFTSHPEPELGEAVRKGRQQEFAAFGWKPGQVPDPQSPATFRHSRLTWDEIDQASHRSMLDWYRALIALRRSRPWLMDGSFERTEIWHHEDQRTLAMTRGRTVVACNFSGDRRTISLRQSETMLEVLLTSAPDLDLTPAGVVLPGLSVAIMEMVS